MKKEKSQAKKSSPVEAGDDTDSVKDLGETTDILNVVSSQHLNHLNVILKSLCQSLTKFI